MESLGKHQLSSNYDVYQKPVKPDLIQKSNIISTIKSATCVLTVVSNVETILIIVVEVEVVIEMEVVVVEGWRGSSSGRLAEDWPQVPVMTSLITQTSPHQPIHHPPIYSPS